ncbi:MAG TPA: hypothetical protein VFR37_05810 [Longimicrobium sp.]|nr:hypothetical protein [Longimicrobium sp.]
MITSQKAVKALFGLAVTGALVFGATEARASAGSQCTFDPPSGQIGYCAGQAACDFRCQNIYGPGIFGVCDGNCCSCAV